MLDKEEILKKYREGSLRSTTDLKDVLREMTREMIDTLYEAELEDHLGYSKHTQGASISRGNSRNGKGEKAVEGNLGSMIVHPPRDRNGTFSPEIIRKRQKDISGIEEKVLSMYGHGMSYSSIRDHIYEIYGYRLSKESISAITDKIYDEAKQWQNRPLEPLYAILFLDGMVISVLKEGRIQKQTMYYIIGYDMDGFKSCLGLYMDATESASYWLTVLTELKNRGLETVLLISVDNLKGLSEAIEAVYPHADIQKCIVHQVRNSMKHISWKDQRTVIKDLRKIYTAGTLGEAEDNLEQFCQIWDKKYPHIGKSWKANWGELSTFFTYSQPLRKIIYTTNPIESFNRQVRKIFKTKGALPGESAAFKLGYLVVQNIEKKWGRQKTKSWGEIFSQLLIYFEPQLKKYNFNETSLHT
jgi:transposase-like protein